MKVKSKINTGIYEANGIIITEEELKRSAHTLIGKPVTLNFGGEIVGKVIDAEYVNGSVEVETEVKDEYVNPDLRSFGKYTSQDDTGKVKGVIWDGLSVLDKKKGKFAPKSL